MNWKLLALAVLLATGALTFGCTKSANEPPASTQVQMQLRVLDDQNTVLVNESKQFATGTNALAAMQELTSVETRDFSFGKMVQSIDGKTPDSQHYWALYVDGQYAAVGIEAITLEKDTQIEWRMEAISAMPGG